MNIKLEKIERKKIHKSYLKDLEIFEKVLSDTTHTICNVIGDKNKCGVLVYKVFENEVNVKVLHVDPKYRGKGVGKAVLQELLKDYNSVKAKPLNENSIKFFTSLGLTKRTGNTYSIVK